MHIWTIYDNPTDFPAGTFVARKFIWETPTLEFMKSNNLEELREEMKKRHLCCIGRLPEDDPKIVEVWL